RSLLDLCFFDRGFSHFERRAGCSGLVATPVAAGLLALVVAAVVIAGCRAVAVRAGAGVSFGAFGAFLAVGPLLALRAILAFGAFAPVAALGLGAAAIAGALVATAPGALAVATGFGVAGLDLGLDLLFLGRRLRAAQPGENPLQQPGFLAADDHCRGRGGGCRGRWGRVFRPPLRSGGGGRQVLDRRLWRRHNDLRSEQFVVVLGGKLLGQLVAGDADQFVLLAEALDFVMGGFHV